MDYSSLPNDPDLPTGTSPWQSSPAPTSRPSFNNSEAGSEPPSPSPTGNRSYSAQGRREEDDSDQETLRGRESGFPESGRTSGETAVQPPNGHSAEHTPPTQHSGFGQPSAQQQQQYRPQQGQQQQQQQHQRAGPPRYHGTARGPQRQLPQYKLQAKITGLERPGRKDPVIRFDVHVGSQEPATPRIG